MIFKVFNPKKGFFFENERSSPVNYGILDDLSCSETMREFWPLKEQNQDRFKWSLNKRYPFMWDKLYEKRVLPGFALGTFGKYILQTRQYWPMRSRDSFRSDNVRSDEHCLFCLVVGFVADAYKKVIHSISIYISN